MTTIDTITSINDHHGDIIATTLLNVCIMAVDRRGGRRMFNTTDFNAFKAMLDAVDNIVPVRQVQQSAPRQGAIEGGVDAVARAVSATLPPNAM